MQTLGFILFGYICGSILFARIWARLFKKEDMIERSRDRNPGTANAFMHGGFWCGLLTLLGDVLKGFVPVFLFTHYAAGAGQSAAAMALVTAAPVLGHIFPVFYKFRGGKGIAVTFGCLLGLLPMWEPVLILAVFFISFSAVLRISPHFYRTLAAYLCSLVIMIIFVEEIFVPVGFAVMTAAVCVRMIISKEEKEKLKVKLLWMR